MGVLNDKEVEQVPGWYLLPNEMDISMTNPLLVP